tara:strand:+ start:286 stop:1398 length:1113 start_codon:yes stop_codon:yes gene_type:complete
MKKIEWHKKSELDDQGDFRKEKWIRKDGDKKNVFPMDLYLGKKTNLLGLKDDIVNNLEKKIKYYQESRKSLYAGNTTYVDKCPVTEADTKNAKVVANIYGAEYVQSPIANHVYVKNRPSENQINDFYLNNITYAATYTSKESAQKRLNSIAVPWLDWVINVYEKQYDRKPKKILDVGSGAGHFVEACRKYGIEADGVELSESSRKFSKETWGIDLYGEDFIHIANNFSDIDIITFWGLLEHTPKPKKLLENAHNALGNESMVIAKVPRWLSLSSAAQRLNPKSIIRHIDPMGHIMLFTDASAAELYYQTHFRPIAAWYYGMDIYELLMQIGNSTGYYDSFLKSGNMQIELQQFVDEQKFSDGLTIVGIPT